MGETTGIEWTDATWNPVRARWTDAPAGVAAPVGWHCEHVSEGCRNCYAEGINRRLGTRLDFKPANLAPRGAVEVFLDEAMLLAPLRWRRPRKVFVGSMTDLFGDWVDDAALDRVFAVMALCPQHVFQLLTKRPERMRAYLSTGHFARADAVDALPEAARHYGWPRAVAQNFFLSMHPLPNVWLGTSVEDQTAADARIPELLATPAATRFLSCEPLLGSVDLASNVGGTLWIGGQRGHDGQHHGTGAPDCPTHLHHHHDDRCERGIDWVIAGGESGPDARPMHPEWARSLRDQCAAAGVPFFFKQWGEWIGVEDLRRLPGGTGPGFGRFDHCRHHIEAEAVRVGKRAAGRLLDGQMHEGMPA